MRLFLLAFVPLVFALDAHRPKQAPARPNSSDSVYASTDSILKDWLKGEAVFRDHPFTEKLYAWVPAAELDSIRQQDALLRKAYSTSLLQSEFHRALFSRKLDKDALAGVLRESAYQRQLPAWRNPWISTARENEDQLIEIHLEDSALLVCFSPGEKNCWRVFDRKGNEFPAQKALAAPGRIAAVFVEDKVSPELTVKAHPFRSFFLVNEKMIRSWHHAVPGMQDMLLKKINYLLLLDAWFKAQETKSRPTQKQNPAKAWRQPADHLSLTGLFFNCESTVPGEEGSFSSFTEMQIARLRACWPKQLAPAEQFPSRQR